LVQISVSTSQVIRPRQFFSRKVIKIYIFQLPSGRRPTFFLHEANNRAGKWNVGKAQVFLSLFRHAAGVSKEAKYFVSDVRQCGAARMIDDVKNLGLTSIALKEW